MVDGMLPSYNQSAGAAMGRGGEKDEEVRNGINRNALNFSF
jgi:hypothetical protein